ncbi:CAAX protease self-immunity [Actinokineospora terrae]|uniref:CAAX protease self-immunity n=2 Tax=Actinokineospora terrae TaxID=155974 RepID=A0A1H9WPS6_9PSEU|nr:CAAX protease self-immunity [Actinokineospora terrae]
MSRRRAWVMAAAVVLITSGVAMVNAAQLLSGTSLGIRGTRTPLTATLVEIVTCLTALAMAWLTVGWRPLGLTLPRRWDKAWDLTLVCGLAWIAMRACAVAAESLIAAGAPGPVPADNGFVLWPVLLTGIAEEVAAATVIVLLSIARTPVWAIIAVVAGYRAVAHLHLGVTAAAATVVWAAALALLMLRCRSVVPLAVAHIAHNATTLS